jgi:integrase
VLDLAAFEKWLLRNYAEASARKIRRDVQAIAAYGPTPPQSTRRQRAADYRWAWRLWADFCEAKGLRNTLPEPARGERQHGRQKRREKPALSLPADSWAVLRKRVRRDDSATGRVLDVLCSTGLRIGDVLRVDEATIAAAMARPDGAAVFELKGAKPVIVSVAGAPKAWARLHEALEPGQRVCDRVGKGGWQPGRGPYKAVSRALKAHAKAIGLDERSVHLHRSRRTVAVQLIEGGASPRRERARAQQSGRPSATSIRR